MKFCYSITKTNTVKRCLTGSIIVIVMSAAHFPSTKVGCFKFEGKLTNKFLVGSAEHYFSLSLYSKFLNLADPRVAYHSPQLQGGSDGGRRRGQSHLDVAVGGERGRS